MHFKVCNSTFFFVTDGKFNNIDANLSMLDDTGYHESFENGENHEEIMEEIYRVNFDQKLFEIEENYDIGEKYNQIFGSQEHNEVFVKVEDIKTECDDIESTSTNGYYLLLIRAFRIRIYMFLFIIIFEIKKF